VRTLSLVIAVAACSAPAARQPIATAPPPPAPKRLAPAAPAAPALAWSDDGAVVVDGDWRLDPVATRWHSTAHPEYRPPTTRIGQPLPPDYAPARAALVSPDGRRRAWREPGEWPICLIDAARPAVYVCYRVPEPPRDIRAEEAADRLRAALPVGRDLYWPTEGDGCARYRVAAATAVGVTLEHRTRDGGVEIVTRYELTIRPGEVVVTGPFVTAPQRRGQGVPDESCAITLTIDRLAADYAILGGDRWWFDAAQCARSAQDGAVPVELECDD